MCPLADESSRLQVQCQLLRHVPCVRLLMKAQDLKSNASYSVMFQMSASWWKLKISNPMSVTPSCSKCPLADESSRSQIQCQLLRHVPNVRLLMKAQDLKSNVSYSVMFHVSACWWKLQTSSPMPVTPSCSMCPLADESSRLQVQCQLLRHVPCVRLLMKAQDLKSNVSKSVMFHVSACWWKLKT